MEFRCIEEGIEHLTKNFRRLAEIAELVLREREEKQRQNTESDRDAIG